MKYNRIAVASLICLLTLLGTITENYADRYLNGIGYALVIVCLAIAVFCMGIHLLIASWKLLRRRQSKQYLISTGIYLLTFLAVLMLPLGRIMPRNDSRVVLRGCREGTQNQAYILFRENQSYEAHYTGVFFYSEWYTGTWQRRGDTLYLHHAKLKSPPLLTDTVILHKGLLLPQRFLNDSTAKADYLQQFFYVGYCRHEN